MSLARFSLAQCSLAKRNRSLKHHFFHFILHRCWYSSYDEYIGTNLLTPKVMIAVNLIAAMKIHLSVHTCKILQELGGFFMQLRGRRDIPVRLKYNWRHASWLEIFMYRGLGLLSPARNWKFGGRYWIGQRTTPSPPPPPYLTPRPTYGLISQ